MNKKLFLIPIVIGIVLYLVIEICIGDDKHGDKFLMEIPDIETEMKGLENIKAVKLLLDNSGSMRGYVDFNSLKSGGAKATMVSTLSQTLDKIFTATDIEPLAQCGQSFYDRSNFRTSLANGSIFKGAVTELGNMIQSVSQQANDTTVVILVSDMILSYGRLKLQNENNPEFNKDHLEELGADIHKAMTDLRKKKLDVLLIHYSGDYNGDFYCNHTENIIPNIYKGNLMKDRPYYLLVIGTESALKGMAVHDCFPQYKHIFASFPYEGNPQKQEFLVSSKTKNWFIGDKANPAKPDEKIEGTIWSNGGLDDSFDNTFIFTCPVFAIPQYVGKSNEKFDVKIGENVQSASYDINGDEMVLTVKLKKYSDLKEADSFVALSGDWDWFGDNLSIDDDTIDDEKNMQGKTWGFSIVVKNIKEGYGLKKQPENEVARFRFRIIPN